jgi:hypothetical protein
MFESPVILELALVMGCNCFGTDEGQDEYEKDGFIVDDADEEEEEEDERESDDERRKKKRKKKKKRLLLIPQRDRNIKYRILFFRSY